jgi:uncharacterized protein YyaL (SSP411 family)
VSLFLGRFDGFRLYDQAQLLQIYLDGYLLLKDPLLLSTVHDIATYIVKDALAHKDGGFYSAEDADSLPSQDASEKKGLQVRLQADFRGRLLCLDKI